MPPIQFDLRKNVGWTAPPNNITVGGMATLNCP